MLYISGFLDEVWEMVHVSLAVWRRRSLRVSAAGPWEVDVEFVVIVVVLADTFVALVVFIFDVVVADDVVAVLVDMVDKLFASADDGFPCCCFCWPGWGKVALVFGPKLDAAATL